MKFQLTVLAKLVTLVRFGSANSGVEKYQSELAMYLENFEYLNAVKVEEKK